MFVLHQKLHLQHHRHTGRLLHHKHTSFRGLAVVLVLAGLCLALLTMVARATADTLTVYASNPAPVPTDAAVITDPVDGAIVTKSSVPVSGTCPDITPRVVIGILDNGDLAGSVACDSSNNFALPIVVTAGPHTLIARVYTITGDAGADSTPVHITYIAPPAVGSVGSEAGASEKPSGSPLTLTVDEPFIVFGPAKDAVWVGTITGGKLPYHLHIDWGDGTSNDYLITNEGQEQYTHHYSKMHPYTILLHLIDGEGRGISRSYAAVTPYVPPVASSLTPTLPPPFRGSKPFGIYGAYLLLLAVFGYLWLTAHSFAYAKVPAAHRPASAQHRKRTPGRR
ncbi:MAG TPA: hypothetical protein VLF69_05100 [Candidatus Saccharimonadales bacterium]|nr:hypothetical protein [Candidatus Saccharimonadales bacterium]